MSLRIIFAGSPEFAAEHLKTLIASEHEVVAVYSQPDRPAGRGRKLTASPVKAVALENDIPVEQPLNFKTEESVATLRGYNADIMVVVAYGIILPQVVLDAPRLGCINVHASVLPRWRGAAPIHRALLAGDDKSGVTIMQMDAGLDTGDMLIVSECPIQADDTSEQLHDRLIEIGQPALLEALAQLEAGRAKPVKQDDARANYAHKLEKSEGLIDWHKTAAQIDCQIRGLTPWPGAFTSWQGQNVRIHKARPCSDTTAAQPGAIVAMSANGFEVATGSGTLLLEVLQMPGKKAMSARDILNARKAAFEESPVFGL
ncbi:methionyl-tRNA formyltransferase [Reinekea marinisedimentorum]|uniref:Methionyl-tRNA formyltransferase n=1 Tax=Reinekea marinisedimentorum TaxID=230495 RepID=A0A4R3ICJ7_9GAMM|nr:methionyl-tRNA formyltransferase [Reinekea marinisedimentorum]TCS43895.1 methionyl-tRNA formyltransferase [Reinekea marinisedimentorum]